MFHHSLNVLLTITYCIRDRSKKTFHIEIHTTVYASKVRIFRTLKCWVVLSRKCFRFHTYMGHSTVNYVTLLLTCICRFWGCNELYETIFIEKIFENESQALVSYFSRKILSITLEFLQIPWHLPYTGCFLFKLKTHLVCICMREKLHDNERYFDGCTSTYFGTEHSKKTL